MKIIIKETQEKVYFELIYPESQINYVNDFIGNTGGFEDGQFQYDSDSDEFTCDKETYKWWAKVIEDHQDLENRIHALKQEHGYETVYQAIGDAGYEDLEYVAASINKALDEHFK